SLILSFGLAFTRYDALSAPEWVGLDNFKALLDHRLFATSLKNSLFFIAVAVPLRVAAALGLALFLHRRRTGVGATRIAVFLPTVIPDAAFALIGLWVFNPLYGPLNLGLTALGFTPPAWLVDPATAKLVFVLMSLFQIGEGFVILLAARSEMSPELFEAASTLGCTRGQAFRYITLPLLMPWLLLLSIRDIMMSFVTTFSQAHLMTQGDPYYATMFTSLLIYEEAFDHFHFGLASAMMLVVFVGCLLLIAVLAALTRRMRHGSD
ncbi:sugar ABC transporter permease, partial [bacterium]